tara:strand:+ start:1836 stop:2606 length:771 start_codon:yes stop_codon:yes gene_type:complete
VRKNLKSRINSGELTIGSWISLGHPAIAEIMSGAGYDWLVVDLEHSTISIDQAGELIRTIDLAGSSPLVRLTSNTSDQIKRVMDAGAHGIIVPMVNCAEDAISAVASTRYGPEGHRGVGLARAQMYGAGFSDYLEWQRDSSIVIVQIEHKDAIGNLEEILSVPGVDGFIIGPYDLSCSLGIPGEFDKPEFKSAMKLILEKGLNMKSPAGLHIVEPNLTLLNETIAKGYSFIAYSVDVRMLDVTAREGMNSSVRSER